MDLRIAVSGRVCTPESPVAAVEDDHLTSRLVFVFDEPQEGSIYLKTSVGSTKDKLLLLRDAENPLEYACRLTRRTVPESGRMLCQLAIERVNPEDPDDVIVWQSRVFVLLVETAIDADTAIAEAYPTILQQWETAMAGYAEAIDSGGLEFIVDGDRVGLKKKSDPEYSYTDHLTGQPGADGTDGREVELRATSTFIQWRYAGETTWNNLVAMSSLKGADGTNGREVELQATSTYIQWRYAGETTWKNLAALSSLKGADGTNGVGISGVAFKETDSSGNNVYTITLTNGATYDFTAPKGATGSKGDTGATGPNSVSTSTATNITGILKGNGSTVEAAVAGTDYAAASHTHSYIPTSQKAAANGVASLDADTKVTAAQASAAVVNVSADLTLASAHAGRFLCCTNASAITITIPTGIAAGTEIEIYRGGAGTVTLSPASGVTFECKESTYGIADQYTSVVLKWRTDSIVVLEGNVG